MNEIIQLYNFLYLKNKLDKLILNSEPFGYNQVDDRIVFSKEAYGKVLADQSTTNPNIYGILHFYMNEKYILLRYNFSCNLNDKLYYYFQKYFIDKIIKYKIREIYKLDCFPDKYNIFSFYVAKGTDQLYFSNNYKINNVLKYFLNYENNLYNINCYNLLLCSAIFYEKEN